MIEGDTADDRKLLDDVGTANGTPGTDPPGTGDASPVFFNPGYWNFWVVLSVPDSSTSVGVRVWWWDDTSETWDLDTRLGTDGETTFTDAEDDTSIMIEGPGATHGYVELINMTGTFTVGVSCWVNGLTGPNGHPTTGG